MNLPQLLHSTRSYGRANSAFSWKLLVLERGFLSYRLKLPSDRSEKDAWSGYSPAGALRKLPFILYSRPAEDWLQRSGSSSTISPITLLLAIAARGRRICSRSSTRRGSREYATTPASMPLPLRHLLRKRRYGGGSARHIESGFRRPTRVPVYSRTSDRFRRNTAAGFGFYERPLSHPTRLLRAQRAWLRRDERNRAGQLQLRALIVSGRFRVVAEVARRNNWMPMSRSKQSTRTQRTGTRYALGIAPHRGTSQNAGPFDGNSSGGRVGPIGAGSGEIRWLAPQIDPRATVRSRKATRCARRNPAPPTFAQRSLGHSSRRPP